jgi:hypothetical protein
MQSYLKGRYYQLFKEEQAKMVEECNFKPNLSLTQRFNRHNVEPARENLSTLSKTERDEVFFNRTQRWREQVNERLERLRDASVDKDLDELTFTPAIKPMISEAQLQ